ncbi:MAG: hypothetical protein QOC54_3963, partial [Baekduia sp.]|nr:hypothetical protein [Baekduia sp.]
MSDNGSPRDGLSPAKQALLELRLQQRAAARSAGPVRRPGDGPFPLSPGQQRMWLIDQLHPGLAAYNVGRVLRIRGELDVAALERAVDGIVARHTALRTALVLEDGGPVQYVRAATPVGIEVVDLTGHADPEAAALALAREEWRRPFALESGRLLRARLIALAPEHHLLVLMIHHAASDEGSKVLLFDELAHRYAAAAAGRDAGLAEPELRYVDVAAWEREQLDAAALAGHLDWWREYLDGAPVELELPHDAPRPAVPTYAGARHHAVLDAEVVARLRALAREQGATLFAVVLAGYATLLSRYSGQDDLVVMAPVAGRGHAAEDVVGLFMNNVVLRVDVGGRPTFRELVARVRESAIGAFRHQDMPFDVLVQELADSRDPGRPPLAETMFNFFEASEAAPRLGDLDVSAVEIDPGTTKIDLALVATVRDGELRLLWEYSSELFSASTVARMTEHLRALLDAAGRAPDTAVGTLPMLSAAERDALTGELARTAAPIPGGGVQDHVAARARERPDAVAVQCGDRTLTYRELDRRANGIARALVDAGVPAGAFVGIALPRSADLPAAVLGVLKAGCAYLPLDPALPQARLEHMLGDSGAAAVLVPAPGARGAGVTEIVVDDDLGAADDPPSAARAAAPGDAAYIIYTSGSTGRPKGVVLEQRNLLNLLASMCREPGIGADDVLLAVTTLSFDISGLELLGPLLAGGRVVISRDGEAADPDALQALLASSGATVLQATPSTWRMLLDAGWPGDPNLRALCGGEALPPALAAELVGRVGSLWNVYGPTETTIWSTCAQITDPAAEITIGTAIANTACYVLDDRDEPVPAGVVGELCIGGAGVARGYHGRPELDAERFVGDPFVPGGRMYRTGDRVRRRADGRLVFLGRGDHQVKLRGHRIELGEIEAVLVRHPAVREAVVALRDDGGTEPRLVAYVTGDADPDALLAFAAESLPAPMLPSLVVELAQMPQTANGKLDRKALPRPPAPVATGAIAPVGELETTIAGVWAAVLGVPTVGRHDDFFRLGGHSLSATRLAARINAEVGARLPMRAIFEAPTVARLARVVEESTAMASTADVPPPPLVREPRDARRVPSAALGHPAVLAALTSDGPTLAAALATATGGGPAAPDAALAFPASFQQRRVWFLDRLETGSALYAVPLVLGIDGPLDADALQHALDGLVARHEILRTTLVEHDGVPVQVVSPPAPFALRSLQAADEAAAVALVREETERPFDLAAGPLARAVLVRVSAERHVVGLVFHHAVADGWSLQLLVDELGALVRGHAPATAVDLQYGDYALWQQRWLRGGVLDAELAWWRTTLSGAPAELELPADRPRPAVSDHAGARQVVLLPGGLLEGLERV